MWDDVLAGLYPGALGGVEVLRVIDCRERAVIRLVQNELCGPSEPRIDLGLQVVNDVTEGWLAPFLPWGLVKTHDIWANCELIDSVDGAVIHHAASAAQVPQEVGAAAIQRAAAQDGRSFAGRF